MDDKHFDDLIRSISSGVSRRRALRSALGGLVAGAAGATALSAEAKQGKQGKAEGKNKGKPGKAEGKNKGKPGKAEGKHKGKQAKNKKQARTQQAAPLCPPSNNADATVAICHNGHIQCVAPSAGGHCGHANDCVCHPPAATLTDCPNQTSCGNCPAIEGGECSIAPVTTTTSTTTTSTTTTSPDQTTSTTTTSPDQTTTTSPPPCSCKGKKCGEFNECGELCGDCPKHELCVVIAPDTAICEETPVCCPNGESGICCSGHHCNGVCCDKNDPGSVAIIVSSEVFNSITVNTPPNTVLVTVTSPPISITQPPAPVIPPAVVSTTPTTGGAGKKKRRRRRRRNHNHHNH